MDILIKPGAGLPSAVRRAASILKEFRLEAQTMPAIRLEVTIRVFNLDGRQAELAERLKQEVAGFKGIVASRHQGRKIRNGR